MVNDHLSVCVGYPGKQVPDGCVSLLVYIFLSLGDGFGQARICCHNDIFAAPERCFGLFYNCLPEMVANTVDM